MPDKQGKITVLHLRDSPWVDGPGRTIHESAAAIDTERFNYIIGAFGGDGINPGPFITEAEKRNLHVLMIKEKSSFDIEIFKQILNYIDEYNVDILHTHEFRSDLIGLICAKVKGIPLHTTVHGFISNNLKGKIYTFANKLILRFFDRVIVVSEKMKKQLCGSFVSERKINVLYNALIFERYIVNREENEFRKEVGVDASVKLIANIGRLSQEKCQDDFILAAKEVVNGHPNAIFLLIGIGPLEDALRRQAGELGIEQNVLFLGYRKDMINIYNGLDLVVQTSNTEGMPNVILESLIMNVPVIATDVGGTGEIVKHNQSGYLMKPNDRGQLVKYINEFMSHPEKLTSMTKYGAQDIREKFNFTDRTNKLMAIYNEQMAVKK